MIRLIGGMILFSALYGFGMGLIHGPTLAAYNAIKFPLYILVTTAVSALGYWIFTLFFGVRLGFWKAQVFALEVYRDISLLLCSLAPVAIFFALTFTKADCHSLNQYPLMVQTHVAMIAVCGTVGLINRGRKLTREQGLGRGKGAGMILTWMLFSLLVGSQAAWYLRPWYGITAIPEPVPFMLRTKPDFRGNTNFFSALVYSRHPPRGEDGCFIYQW